MRNTMLAAVITRFGSAPTITRLDVPTPAENERLVKVETAALNPLDYLIASGTWYGSRPDLPYVPGREGVGRLVGQSRGDELGERVYFRVDSAPGGAAAEYAIVREGRYRPVPSTLASTQAAALGVAGCAALLALTRRGRFALGETVAVLGASGAVGATAVQLAATMGARRVVAVGRGALPAYVTFHDVVRSVEISSVTSDQEGTSEWVTALAEAIRVAADGDVDLVIDPIWGAHSLAALHSLAANGRLVNIGSSSDADMNVPSALVRGRSLHIIGHTNALFAQEISDVYDELSKLASSDMITIATEEFPLEDAATAWARVSRTPRVKVILQP